MNTEIEKDGVDLEPSRHTTTLIEVNELPVTVTKHRMRGAEIKAAAIAQHVPIQPSFTLILKQHGRPSEVIGDDDEVTMHKGQHFSCLPGDDNS